MGQPADPMYEAASFLVKHSWSQPRDVANGLGVLLLTWNQAFYRYGQFNFDRLERCIEGNRDLARGNPGSGIFGAFGPTIGTPSCDCSNSFAAHLRLLKGTSRGKKSSVSAAKALHLLAPRFFPLWDQKIERSYRRPYSRQPADAYFAFIQKTRPRLLDFLRSEKRRCRRGSLSWRQSMSTTTRNTRSVGMRP